MKLSAKQRWILLSLASVATLVAMVSADQLEREAKPGKTVTAKSTRSANPAAESVIALDKLKRAPVHANAVNVFASKSWYVPPPPPKALPPPPPTAPPLPFTYMGKLSDTPGNLTIFLVRGDQVYTVKPGDVIDTIYRVEGVNAGQLTLTYLPLDVKQTINIGNDS